MFPYAMDVCACVRAFLYDSVCMYVFMYITYTYTHTVTKREYEPDAEPHYWYYGVFSLRFKTIAVGLQES